MLRFPGLAHPPVGVMRDAAPPTVWVRLFLVAMLFCSCTAPVVVWGQAKLAAKTAPVSSASTTGQWAAPVYFCSALPCVVGANAAVLNTGQVLFYYYPPNPTSGSQALLLDPVTGNITWVSLSVVEDIFCSGLTVLPNGQVMVTGGTVVGSHTGVVNNRGTTSTMLFDPGTSTWATGQDMYYARWYPSSIELTDGTALELSGMNATGTMVQTVLESYDYTTGYWTALPASADIPSISNYPYPRLSLLPSGNVLLSSPSSQTYQFNPTTNAWAFVAANNYGDRFFSSHVLLPGQEQVMVAGGTSSKLYGGGTATNTAEIIDMSATNPVWTYTGAMTYARYNENLVLLADGTVLAVGGGGGGGQYVDPIFTPELYNPATGAVDRYGAPGNPANLSFHCGPAAGWTSNFFRFRQRRPDGKNLRDLQPTLPVQWSAPRNPIRSDVPHLRPGIHHYHRERLDHHPCGPGAAGRDDSCR